MYEAKAGAKRWAAVLDGEARPLAEDELQEKSEEYQRGYLEYKEAQPLEEEDSNFMGYPDDGSDNYEEEDFYDHAGGPPFYGDYDLEF